MVDETKFIGIYECRKAIFKETYTEDVFNEFGQFEAKTKERTTTAWYTMQIPISNGPLDFGGLPGIILEINDGELTLVCTRVTLNPKKRRKDYRAYKWEKSDSRKVRSHIRKKIERNA